MSRDEPLFIILAEGNFGVEAAKTASSAVRYLPGRVGAVIDSVQAGLSVQQVLGFGGEIPVVGSLEEALARAPEADALLIGIAPQGGALPEEWRIVIRAAVEAGLDVWSGLHTFLSDDPELAEHARRAGVRLRDLRRPPRDLPIGTGKAAESTAFRVLTVGTDCNVGKMTAALEVRRELRARGLRASFAGTGQTGILIEGRGIAVDAVVSDFVAGAAEQLTLDAAEGADVVLVEGQGSLIHPGYSGVTLGLIHGCMPQALLLSSMPNRKTIYGGMYDWVEIPPLDEVVALYEEAARWSQPPFESRVVGIACATWDLPEAEARREVARAHELTGLPATDPIRFGAGELADAILQAMGG
ncbi:MAG: DUF1611 domain-containing protein [Gemmatimonadota bacterium]